MHHLETSLDATHMHVDRHTHTDKEICMHTRTHRPHTSGISCCRELARVEREPR